MKIKNSLVGILGLVSLAATGCNGKECKNVRKQLDERVGTVLSYINTRPEMADLNNGGCAYMLALVSTYPKQAEQVRTLAKKKFAVTRSECLEYRYYDRTIPRMDGGFDSSPSRVCTRWETYTAVKKPREYEQAMKVAADIDVAYAETNQLCAAVSKQDQAGMEMSIDALEERLALELLPRAQEMLTAACGK